MPIRDGHKRRAKLLKKKTIKRHASFATLELGDDNMPGSFSAAVLHRPTFPWVVYQDEIEYDDGNLPSAGITANQVATEYGVPASVVDMYLSKEISEAESCQNIPFMLFFVACYAGAVLNHWGYSGFASVENSLVISIEEKANFGYSKPQAGFKALYDVNSHTDFWSWLSKGLVPLLFVQESQFSESFNRSDLLATSQGSTVSVSGVLPRHERGFILHHNRIVGGLRLRQERSDQNDDDCTTPESLLVFYRKPCVGGHRYELEPESRQASTTRDPQEEEWLHVHDDLAKTHSAIAALEAKGWLDDFTQKIEITLAVYNAELGVHAIILINFFFPRGGHIWKKIVPLSIRSTLFSSEDYVLHLLVDICVAGCLFWIIIVEAKEIAIEVRTNGLRGIYANYIGFWNTVDWMSAAVGAGLIASTIMHYDQLLDINRVLFNLTQLDEEVMTQEYRRQAAIYVRMVHQESRWSRDTRITFACYAVVITIRLLKSFSNQPRLSILTRTLWLARVDLIHYLFVFAWIFLTFTSAAVVLFGHEADDFATFFRAILSSFRATMGDFDLDALMRVGRIEAGVWFVCFTVVIVMMMFNILIAILMDKYSEIMHIISTTDTLLQEVVQGYTRWIGQKRGELVPLDDILEVLRKNHHQLSSLFSIGTFTGRQQKTMHALGPFMDKDGDIRMVTVAFLREHVLKMKAEQAESLLVKAATHFFEGSKEKSSLDLLQLIVHEIHAVALGIRKVLVRTIDSVEDSTSIDEGEVIQAPDEAKAAFRRELALCRDELSQARLWIGLAVSESPAEDIGGEMKNVSTAADVAVEDVRDRSQVHVSAIDEQGGRIKQKRSDLERHIADGRRTLAEGLAAVSELESRLMCQRTNSAESQARRNELRREVTALERDNQHLDSEAKRSRVQVDALQKALDADFGDARRLAEENRQLRSQFEALQAERERLDSQGDIMGASPLVTIEQLKQQAQMEQHRLESAREGSRRALTAILDAVQDVVEDESSSRGASHTDTTQITQELQNMLEVAHNMVERRLHFPGHQHRMISPS
eukprot:TRINITY_DN38601_c0_g1_i1.p1 TRINITY_DN38601_c0_g1~~TRINITY_DN38601_c0_g1_i1.p1  ORF type:complete len:1045 (-),score=155.80 TRINITY_DN38601_c0_g1_i1:52-3186(-)